jgi:hypothetical protein
LIIPGLVLSILGMLLLVRIGDNTPYVTYVLPAELLMSVGLAAVFIPAASTALIGVGPHDAGVASAVLNSSQQVGGSLGTALLNTVFAATVTAYLAANAHTPQEIAQLTPTALIHGYHVSFIWGAALFTAALLCAVFLINAKKEDVPAEAGVPAG